MRCVSLVLLVMLSLAACARRVEPTRVASVRLENGIVAKVGDIEIGESLIGAVASVCGIAPRGASNLLIDDALAARGARAHRLDVGPLVARALTTARARSLLRHVRDSVRVVPPNEDELAEYSAIRWRDVDLTEQVRVVHAVVMRKKGSTGTDDVALIAAREIEKAVALASSGGDFEAFANRVPHPGHEVRVEELPPFVRDGRVSMGPEASMDGTFAAAAFSLSDIGATSSVVETTFGWHVIRLLERLPARHVPHAERSAYLAEDIYRARARRLLGEAIASASSRTHVEIDGAAESLVAELHTANP
jgi:hypothetical protein